MELLVSTFHLGEVNFSLSDGKVILMWNLYLVSLISLSKASLPFGTPWSTFLEFGLFVASHMDPCICGFMTGTLYPGKVHLKSWIAFQALVYGS